MVTMVIKYRAAKDKKFHRDLVKVCLKRSCVYAASHPTKRIQ